MIITVRITTTLRVDKYQRLSLDLTEQKLELLSLGTWWWGRIPPNQPYPKGAAPAATTLLAE